MKTNKRKKSGLSSKHGSTKAPKKVAKARTKTTKKIKPKLYALLVGIGDYKDQIILNEEVIFPKLTGPAKDVAKIENLLKNDAYYEPKIIVLNDREATKAKIVSAFTNHLTNATESDVALFYFSGHGTQEFTNGLFQSETDGKLESLVTWFDDTTKDNCLLADKELRWLISKVAKQKPHIVTIFDCCHSTDVTRNAGLAKHAAFDDRTVEKRVAYVFPQRPWKHFAFSKEINETDMTLKGDAKLLPESPHVSLTACESNESALEIGGEGVFTKFLLTVLRKSNGNISYEKLASRVRLLMQGAYEQQPWIYAPQKSRKLLLSKFLSKPLNSGSDITGEIINKGADKWLLNLGAIHGLTVGTEVEVLEPQTLKSIGTATVKEVFVSSSVVTPQPRLDNLLNYPVATTKSLTKSLRLHLASSASLVTDQKKVIEGITSSLINFSLEASEGDADYCLRFLNGLYYITKPGAPYSPLVEPVSVDDENFVDQILILLNHLSTWEFFRTLENKTKGTQLDADALDVEVTVLSNGKRLTKKGTEKLKINFLNDGNGWTSAVTIKLANKSKKDLYVCAQYLSTNYQASTQWTNPPVYLLEPGNSVLMEYEGTTEIPVYLDPLMTLLNLRHQIDQINFIVSQEKFESSLLELPQLPMLSPNRSKTRETKAGFGVPLTKREDDRSPHKWSVRRLFIELINPLYNKANYEQLEEWLQDESIADFIAGTYFDMVPHELDFKLVLKPGIELISTRKGLIGDKILDIANWWARRSRNRYFSRMSEKYPDKIKIVAEGDSWFQHPLVLDIIDHLSKLYSIYCVSAAGDTLMNYMSEEKKNGQYFLEAIRDHDPAIFLISGGGNDILGSQFRSFLVDNPDVSQAPGKNPDRFLKPSIFSKINDLMGMYSTILTHLQVHFPKLQIIMHGYDYPIKLDDAKKGWLGRYMIEKGIKRRDDRVAIIRLIMDTFNERLQRVAESFKKNATYIDARNIVREDQWYDEIHPDNNGFQLVAMKFMQRIDEIVAVQKTEV